MNALRRLRSGLYLAALLCALVLPADALGSEGEAQVFGGLRLTNLNEVSDEGQWGPGAQAGVLFGINDFWSLVAGAEASLHPATDDPSLESATVTALFAGFRYNLDVFTYVPYLGVSVTNFVSAPPLQPGDDGPGVGARLSIGMDYRYSREWSFGGKAELHAPLTSPLDFPMYSAIGAQLAYHFRL